MRRHVTIDLTIADIAMYEAYEASVLPLVERHGGRVVLRVRSLDGRTETHLLLFPDPEAFERYRSDPERLAVVGRWEKCGARAAAVEVQDVPAPDKTSAVSADV